MIKKNEYYQCNECKMKYRNKNLADKCEQWCKKHYSCNTEIIKHAIK